MAQNKLSKKNISHKRVLKSKDLKSKKLKLNDGFSWKEFSFNILLVLLSSVFYFLMFPNFLVKGGVSLLGFIAFTPFFYVIITSEKFGWLYSFLMGFVSYAFFNSWLYNFHSLSIFIVTFFMGFFYLLFFFVFKFTSSRIGRFRYLYLALLWVLFEYLKSFGFFGYSFGILGYSQFLSPIGRLASVGGVRFVSFFLVFFSAYFAYALKEGLSPFFKREWKVFLGVSVLFVFSFVLAFVFKPKEVLDKDGEKVEFDVMLVQHCTNNWKAGYRDNLETLQLLTDRGFEKNSSSEPLDFIIWSETAFIPGIFWHTNYDTDLKTKRVVADFVDYVSSTENIFITGNSNGRLADINKPAIIYNSSGKAVLNRKDYNGAVVYLDGEFLGSYNKQRLVPFTEYFPLRKYMPLFSRFLDSSGAKVWDSGDGSEIFEYNDKKFAINICFEDSFAYLVRNDVKAGADFLINLTNDYWSRSLPAQMQHLSMSVFRAIEFGIPVVRSTNSGMSGVISPCGKIEFLQKPFSKRADVTNVIVSYAGHTIYYYLGDWFLFVVLLFVLIFLIRNFYIKYRKD